MGTQSVGLKIAGQWKPSDAAHVDMQARLLPRTNEEYERCKQMGLSDPKQALTHDQLVNAEDCLFVATGITNNMLISGIRQNNNKFITKSIIIHGKDKKLRYVETEHFCK